MKIENNDKFWLVDDGIYLTNNLYFGIGKSYYCGHGCQTCFIRDDLIALKGQTDKIYNNDLHKMQKAWDEVYSFFPTVALDEDPYFFKTKYLNEYQWYLDNSHKCSYGTTDNGIFRIGKIIESLKFKSMSEITLSISFIMKVGAERIIPALEHLMPIEKLKFIIDVDGDYPTEIVDWARAKDMPIVVHKTEFVSKKITEFETMGFDMVQEVDWVSGKEGEDLIKIHINSDVILYYDSFYFSNNIGDVPYFKLDENGFDYRRFLSSMLEGKQKDYLKYSKVVQNEEMKSYFINTLKYKVNHDYNFIPNFMIDYNIKYYHRMIELGWQANELGLVYPAEKVVPIIELRKI